MCEAAMMSGPRSISKSLLISAAERFRKLGPPSARAREQFGHLQKASGKAFAAAVPRKVMIICNGTFSVWRTLGRSVALHFISNCVRDKSLDRRWVAQHLNGGLGCMATNRFHQERPAFASIP